MVSIKFHDLYIKLKIAQKTYLKLSVQQTNLFIKLLLYIIKEKKMKRYDILQRDENNFRSPAKNFVSLGVIGHGSFSEVHKVRRVEDGKIYALKKIKLGSLKPKQIQYAISQIKILAAFSCQFVISFRQSFYDQKMRQLSIVLEWANQGDLQNDIQKRKKSQQVLKMQLIKKGALTYQVEKEIEKYYIPQSQVWRAVRDILCGLSVLHSSSILHRDIKTANIFKSEGIYKLGDLNIAKICTGLAYAYTQTGTPYYASPQVWKQLPYNSKSDIWSFGCVVYEMCQLVPPFIAADMNMLYEMVIKGKYRRINTQIYSRQLAQLIDICLSVDPKERKSCQQILNLSWVMAKFKQYNIKVQKHEGSFKRGENDYSQKCENNSNQLENKQICVKLLKQMRQLRSITQPCVNNMNLNVISSLENKNFNKILPTPNYPNHTTQRNEYKNHSQFYDKNMKKDIRTNNTSAIQYARSLQKIRNNEKDPYNLISLSKREQKPADSEAPKLINRNEPHHMVEQDSTKKKPILNSIPLSQSFDLKIQEKNSLIMQKQTQQYHRQTQKKENPSEQKEKNKLSSSQNKYIQEMKNRNRQAQKYLKAQNKENNKQDTYKRKNKKRVLIIPSKSAKLGRYNGNSLMLRAQDIDERAKNGEYQNKMIGLKSCQRDINRSVNMIQNNEQFAMDSQRLQRYAQKLKQKSQKKYICEKIKSEKYSNKLINEYNQKEKVKLELRLGLQKKYRNIDKTQEYKSEQKIKKKENNIVFGQDKSCEKIKRNDSTKYKYKYKFLSRPISQTSHRNHLSMGQLSINNQKNMMGMKDKRYQTFKKRPLSVQGQIIQNKYRSFYKQRAEAQMLSSEKKSGEKQKKKMPYIERQQYMNILNRENYSKSKIKGIESLQELPRIREILVQRSSNIRQQIGRIYYNCSHDYKSNESDKGIKRHDFGHNKHENYV